MDSGVVGLDEGGRCALGFEPLDDGGGGGDGVQKSGIGVDLKRSVAEYQTKTKHQIMQITIGVGIEQNYRRDGTGDAVFEVAPFSEIVSGLTYRPR